MRCTLILRVSNRQCVALLLCLLFLSQDVVARLHERPPYESQFDQLFTSVKDASESLSVLSQLHVLTKVDKAMAQNMVKIVQFAKDNPATIGVAIGMAASSWLLKNSIALASEMKVFFNDIKELEGRFDEYYSHKVPRLVEMFERVKQIVDNSRTADEQKKYFRELQMELMTYYQDLAKTLDDVVDEISDVRKAKNDAEMNVLVSTTVAVLAGIGLIASITMTPNKIVAGGAAVTGAMAVRSRLKSLENASELTEAEDRLQQLKRLVRNLRDHVHTKIMDITKLMQ